MENPISDRRKQRCKSPGCKGMIFRRGDNILCTNCNAQYPARRREDKGLADYIDAREEWNG